MTSTKALLFYVLALTFLLGLVPNALFAEIKNPYVIDEKPQVAFGDSVPVLVTTTLPSGDMATTTYFGLENYYKDYVEGYLHLSFTYTHSRCCFSSYPPRIYITDLDPRETNRPLIKYNQKIFRLLSIPIPPGHETDWYLYDIQFDANGYRLIVKMAGTLEIINEHRLITDLSETDWVALANLYPELLPPATNIYSMAFTPVTVMESEPPRSNPMVIIPGIMGSAYKNGKLVIDPILHTYDDLIATLVANGYVEDEDLFTFPYEWRDSNVFSADLLDDKIDEIKTICGCQKVDIVAHSMGGLVARSYIQSFDYDSDVDQLIFLGTPHKGAPKAYLQWEAGESDIDIRSRIVNSFFLAEAIKHGYLGVFGYIRNRPILSVQELLPTFDYLKDNDTGLLRSYPTDYPTNSFIDSLNNNISKLLTSEVRVTNITGESEEDTTIERIRVVPTAHSLFWEHGEPDGFTSSFGDNGLERSVGDNTVTANSSFLNGFVNEEIAASHNRIPTVSAGQIVEILTGKESVQNVDTGVSIDPKILLLQLLSPIDAVITAPDGKKVGKNFETGQEYNEIPLAFYSGFETGDEYVTIPNPLDGDYQIEVIGTESGGEYGLLTSLISDDVSITKSVSGLTQFGQITDINLEVDNENPEEFTSEKLVTLEVLLSDINKAFDLGFISDERLKKKLIKQVEATMKTETKITEESKSKKIEKLWQKIDKKLLRALLIELKGYERGKINEQAYNIIKADLESLLNN